MAGKRNRVLTDHDEIRKWAESRKASPACVRGTGGKEDVGMIRLDFPGYSGETSLEHIDWDERFDKFDENGLALIVEDTTSGGEKSNFNKLVSRGTVEESGRKRSASKRKATTSSRGGAKKASAKRGSASPAKKSAGTKHASTRGRSGASKRSSGTRGTASRTAGKKTTGRKSTKRAAGRRR